MNADRRKVGWRDAYRCTVSARGALRLYLCLSGRELELLLVSDPALPGRGLRRCAAARAALGTAVPAAR